MSTTPTVLDRIRVIADAVFAAGGTRTDMNMALRRELGVEMGRGGRGPYPGIPECPYCGAYGGGGHGGFCPGLVR